MIAIGALTTALETVQNVSDTGLSLEARRKYGEPHHKFALQQYGQALKLMRDMPSGSRNFLRNALLSCLLTTCFENYIGNQDSALAQARAGINLLIEQERSVCAETPSLSYFLKGRSVEDNDLYSTFARLDMLVMLLQGITRQVPTNPVPPLGPEDSASFRDMPNVFESVREARICWDLSIRRAMQWNVVFLQQGSFSFIDLQANGVTDASKRKYDVSSRLVTENELYVAACEQWLRAFQPLFDKSRKSEGSRDFLGATVLMIKFLGLRIVTRVQGPHEVDSDVFLHDYIMIVNLARDLLEASASANTSRKRAVVLFDDSLVSTLFLVATHCRERSIREQAVNLLRKYPRREGFWDSEMAVKVCTWFMNQEEEGRVEGHVPEAARLRLVKMDLRLSERKVVIGCSKLSDGGEERMELPEVTLTW